MTTNIEEAISVLERIIKNSRGCDQVRFEDGRNVEHLCDCIQALINTVNREKWIPVSERLPEIEDDVVYWGEHTFEDESYSCHGTTFFDEDSTFEIEENPDFNIKVKYWKPINPPKEYE